MAPLPTGFVTTDSEESRREFFESLDLLRRRRMITVAYIEYTTCQNAPSRPELGEVDENNLKETLIDLLNGKFEALVKDDMADSVNELRNKTAILKEPLPSEHCPNYSEVTYGPDTGYFGDARLVTDGDHDSPLFVTFPDNKREQFMKELFG
jgi:hypothetical protein